MWQCQECGRKFRAVATAERASRRGCSCGGTDIDLAPQDRPVSKGMKVMTNVFVYGTLKRGQRNHERFIGGAAYLGEAQTEPDYRLWCNGAYPVLCPATDGPGDSIRGEVYALTDDQLLRLDRLEAGYARKVLSLKTPDGRRMAAYAYLQEQPSRFCRPAGDRWDGPVKGDAAANGTSA